MKIKIQKKENLNESILKEEKELLSEYAQLVARALPILARYVPKLAKAAGAIEGVSELLPTASDEEKQAQAIASEIIKQSAIRPMGVESKQLAQHTQILDDLRQVLQQVSVGISALPQDPDALATKSVDAGGAVTGLKKASPSRARTSKDKKPDSKVVAPGPSEGKRVKNLKYLS